MVGVADCLALAGATLTPAEFFRGCVGLVEPVFVAQLDRSLVSAVAADCLTDLSTGSVTAAAIARVLAGSPLLVDTEWCAPHRSPVLLRRAIDDAMATTKADIGTALLVLAPIVASALAAVRTASTVENDWQGWLVAARLPTLLLQSGLTSSALPCLTGLTRGLRYTTVSVEDLEIALWSRLGEQARQGLAMLRRLEACVEVWRERLTGLTARSRAGQAAGLFLVWPACTRPQLAAALGVTGAGAGVLLDALISRDIVERMIFRGTSFYVAPESLGDFKLAPRQGRHPALPSHAPITTAMREFDAELAAFDLLGIALGPAGIVLPHPTRGEAERTDISL